MAATPKYFTSTATGIYKDALTQVNDLATKNHLPVRFFDYQEHGPVRKRVYSVTIKVGTLSAVGQGHSKKQARATAAANVLEPLKQMCLVLENNQAKPVKDLKPNGYLFEAAQANGWGYPKYTLLGSRPLPWGWLFTMSVSVQGVDAIGTGPTKKAAKQNAAAKMLETLGFECPKYPLIDKKDTPANPQVNLVNEQVEEEDLIENRTVFSSDPETCFAQDCEDRYRAPDVIIEEIVEYLDEDSAPCETDSVLDLISLCEIVLEIQTESEEPGLCEAQDKETEPETETNQTSEIVGPEMSSQPEDDTKDVFGENIPDEGPVSDSDGTAQVLRETEVFPAQEDISPAPGSDQDHTPESSEIILEEEFEPSPSYDGPDAIEDSMGPIQCEGDPVISEDSPVEASVPDGPPVVLKETEVLQLNEDITIPGSDQDHTSEQDQGISKTPETVTEVCKTAPSTDLFNITEDSTGPELSVKCEVDPPASDQSGPCEILLDAQTGSELQGLCEAQDTETDQETQTHQITELCEDGISSQKDPTSPPQVLDGPPVAAFLIRALVQKLVQKNIFRPEDQGEVVKLLLEKTKERILNQDIPISIKNMRAVGKAAAKDLLKDFKLQGAQLSAEDETFQEATVKHLNYRLNTFLFGPKKKGLLSRLCAAVGRFFCAQ